MRRRPPTRGLSFWSSPFRLPRVIEGGVGVNGNNLKPPGPLPWPQYYLPAIIMVLATLPQVCKKVQLFCLAFLTRNHHKLVSLWNSTVPGDTHRGPLETWDHYRLVNHPGSHLEWVLNICNHENVNTNDAILTFRNGCFDNQLQKFVARCCIKGSPT